MKNINLIKEVIEMVENFNNKYQDVLEESDKENNEIFLEDLNKMLNGSLKYDEEFVKMQKEFIESLDEIYSI